MYACDIFNCIYDQFVVTYLGFFLLSVPSAVTKLHIIAKLDEVSMKMCDHENDFAQIQVSKFEYEIMLLYIKL